MENGKDFKTPIYIRKANKTYYDKIKDTDEYKEKKKLYNKMYNQRKKLKQGVEFN